MFRQNKQSTRSFLAIAFGIIFFAAIGCQAQLPVGIDLETQGPGKEIPRDYPGLSFEMQRVLADTNGRHFFSPENRRLIATFQTLGIKNLRVGGNTADRPALPVPTEADVDSLFAFAKAAEVKIIYTLRLNHGDPAADAKMAKYIFRHYRNQLDCFAIGNEPNVFSTNYDEYAAEWKRYAAAITAPTSCRMRYFAGRVFHPDTKNGRPVLRTTLRAADF